MEIIHKFEKAGLGKPPYRLTSYARMVYKACPDAPTLPGSSCDYCGTGIMDVFWLKSSDGKEFKVGSDCILKAEEGHGMTRLYNEVERAAKELKKEAAKKRLNVRIEAAFKVLIANPTLLTDKPHPSEYYNAIGKTCRDYVLFLFDKGGDAGKNTACKLIEKG